MFIIDLSPLKRHRDFRLLYIGQTLSFIGSMLTYVAVPYQVFELTQSALWVGLLGSVQLVPLLIAGLLGGALADAVDRRRMLVISEVIMAAGSLGMLINAALPHPSAIALFALSALMSGVNGFHRPALDALTPRLVHPDDLPAVAALGSLRFNAGAIGGPACAGLLISHYGLSPIYIIDVISFGASVWCLIALREVPTPRAEEASSLARIAEGLRYARSRPELIGTYVVDIVAMTFAMPMALFPGMGQRWGGASATGWLYSSMAIGSLVMTVFSGWTSRVRQQAAVVWAAAIWGVAVVALGFVHSLPLAVGCLALAGAADMVSGLFRMTIWNQTIPDTLRGRLAGVEMISYMTGPLLGNARAGFVATSWGEQVSIVSGGALCVLGVLACVPLLPGFVRYVKGEPPSVAAARPEGA
ncbi:MAG TPA: MFS transporter [Polyangiaceae bacterium]|nr:MFS transporter [Polyangiaceae bacterium]